MSRKRQEQQAEEMRRRILNTARGIVEREGPEALSIRRIAGELEYSPGSLYYYFKSKDEILHQLLMEGYGKILESIRRPMKELPPDQAVRESVLGYLEGVLQWPLEYRAVMFSSATNVLEVTSVLDSDVAEKRKAIAWLAENVETGVRQGIFAPCDPVLTAQAVWCAVFGLAARLVIEGTAWLERGKVLAERQAELLVRGMQA